MYFLIGDRERIFIHTHYVDSSMICRMTVISWKVWIKCVFERITSLFLCLSVCMMLWCVWFMEFMEKCVKLFFGHDVVGQIWTRVIGCINLIYFFLNYQYVNHFYFFWTDYACWEWKLKSTVDCQIFGSEKKKNTNE